MSVVATLLHQLCSERSPDESVARMSEATSGIPHVAFAHAGYTLVPPTVGESVTFRAASELATAETGIGAGAKNQKFANCFNGEAMIRSLHEKIALQIPKIRSMVALSRRQLRGASRSSRTSAAGCDGREAS